MQRIRAVTRAALAGSAAFCLVVTVLVASDIGSAAPVRAVGLEVPSTTVGAVSTAAYARPAGAPEAPIQPCSRYAASAGDDANPGTKARPVKNIRTLTLKLQPGQTGCVKDDDTIELDAGGWGILFGGTRGNPKVIRPETPGLRSTVIGPDGFLVDKDQSDLVLKDLDLRRTGNGGLITVDGDRVVLDGVDLANPKNICLGVGGDARAGEFDKTAEDFVLIDSRVHGCGTQHLNDPHDVGGAHGVYLKLTRDGDGDGRGAIIYNTLLDHNKDRGLQLYPDADDVWAERIVIAHNGANLNFGSEPPVRSENARISHAIIADSRLDFDDPVDPNPSNTNDVLGNFAGGLNYGADNIVSDSCLSNTIRPGHLFEVTGGGDSVKLQDVTTNRPPSFVDAAGADYRLAPGSSCQGMGLADASRLPYGPEGGEEPGTPVGMSAPRDVTAVAGNGRATVSWLPPIDLPTGAFMEYRVEAIRAGDSRNGSECIVERALRCVVTGLNNLPNSADPYTFTVRGSDGKGHYSELSAPSNGVRPQAPVEFRARIVGTARVGGRLSASATGIWPSGSALRYQWLRGTSAIRGATRPSYTPTSADVGVIVRVRVTGSKTDYVSSSITAKTAKKIAAIPVKVRRISYTGTMRAGKRLTAKVSGLAPSSAKAHYRWYRGSRAIHGATKRSYTLKNADAGKRITLRVVFTAKNYLTTIEKYAKRTKVKARR